MKRTIVSLALVTAFVFAFAAVAMAAVTPSTAYMGFTPIRTQEQVDAGYLQGFISFAEARAEMQRNGVNGALQNTAHGGYVTSTTLCVVCHSAHRAPGINPDAAQGNAAGSAGAAGSINAANVANQSFLTAGSGTCESCHTTWGSQASRLLVEWAEVGAGPHASAGNAVGGACILCHNAGVHGLSGSRFNVMNVFMLGNTRNTAPDHPTSPTSVPTETRDEQIAREIAEGRVLRGGTLDVPVTSDLFEDRAADSGTLQAGMPAVPTAESTWWYNGARSLGPIGTTPPAFGEGVTAGGNQYGAARSLATAYTCGESGCHDATAMFNLNWGMGFERVDNVRGNPVPPAFNPTLPPRDQMIRQGTTEITGHVMPSVRVAGGENQACGPCHGGNPAGFPTASTVAGARDNSRLAFGCDQCHDMVGVATNSTAWPHGNRNIYVYEWEADGTQLDTGNTVAAGNLWMYGGNIARSMDLLDLAHSTAPEHSAVTTLTVTMNNTLSNAVIISEGGGTAFRGNTSENLSFADQSWTVLTGVTSGRYGIPSTTNNPAGASAPGTGLLDGSCLKCHVPLDIDSREAMNAMGADALRHAWVTGQNPYTGEIVANHGSGGRNNNPWGALNPIFQGVPASWDQSQRLFLYR